MRKGHKYLLAILAAVVLVTGFWLARRRPSGSGPARNSYDTRGAVEIRSSVAELPPVATSPFANTAAEVPYVGKAACAECHADEYESYLLTSHSRALSEVDREHEPQQIEFDHPLSGRRYRVYRQGNQIRHREFLVDVDGGEIELSDYHVRYTIGSGNHSRSYLVEADGFLLESPITWYTAGKAWSLSPGYDVPHHPGFERLVDVGCLICHAGRVEAAAGSRFRVNIHEATIGCESCHGPGALHVESRRQETDTGQAADLTIVHPARLSRSDREAICAQCHLRGEATVIPRGRSISSFRPGLRLQDFRVDYVLARPDRRMEVVGHVEQMRLSRCYQQSETLTCTTCHDPHGQPRADSRVAYYRQKCLDCHAVDGCGLPPAERLQRDQNDNCVVCHMPQSPTDIRHFAFTHHRIGVHPREQQDPDSVAEVAGRLVPLFDVSHLPAIEQERCLGLAYLEVSEKQASDETYQAYRNEAYRLLSSVYERGLRDIEVNSALARLYWEQGRLRDAIPLAQAAAGQQSESGAVANALLVQADAFLQLDQPTSALAALQQLVKRRRMAQDWVLLAVCLRGLGRLDEATEALLQAAAISPARRDLAEMLAQWYGASGERQSAEKWRKRADKLRKLGPP